MKSQTTAAATAGSSGAGKMWFWLFVAACCVVVLIGIVFERVMQWSMAGIGVLWAIGIVAEIVWNWRQERTLNRQAEEGTPLEAPSVAAAGSSVSGKAG